MTTTATFDHHGPHGHGCGHGHRWRHHGGYGYSGHYGYGPSFPVKAAIVVGGLALFPPLGLAALAYFALRHRFAGHPGWEAWRADKAEAMKAWRDRAAGEAPTGNAAFEARRQEVLDKIEAERQKLRDEAKAFADFAEKEKRARDQAEFDRFQAEKARGGEPPASA